ncbi:hypothetical protein FRY77_13445 [Halomonas sp. MG34]|nr:hypothetical protein [Halomonas sp. MG34]
MQKPRLEVLMPSNSQLNYSQLNYSQLNYAQLIFIGQQRQMSFGVQAIER